MKHVRTAISERGFKLAVIEWEAIVDPDGPVERIAFVPEPMHAAPPESGS